jgi:uncharacterized protein YjbJ (UPF0337 family)
VCGYAQCVENVTVILATLDRSAAPRLGRDGGPKLVPRCRTSPRRRERASTMNWDQVQGRWDRVKGNIKQSWGKLTDDELDKTKGRRDQIIGRIRERYGAKKEEIEDKLDALIARI